MSDVLGQFHFLRPAWLLLIPAALLIWRLSIHRSDVRGRWREIIAPHLLDALVVGRQKGWRIRPIHLVTLAVIIGAAGLSGPAWERELPPFTEDKALMVVVLDLSQSMDAIDIQPTRLERQAYSRFGEGRHLAGLNYGDCLAYALAVARGESLLYKGEDFARTDVPSAG